MTRAANYVCDQVRENIDPSFRTVEGALLVTRGMTLDRKVYTYRKEYRGEKRNSQPYPGLNEFLDFRESRSAYGDCDPRRIAEKSRCFIDRERRAEVRGQG
jgi:hypothetical protein